MGQVLEHPLVQGLQSPLGESVNLGNIGRTVITYLLVPLVMTRAVEVLASLVIGGAMTGAVVGGLADAFLAVPVVTVLAVVHRRVLVPTGERR